MAASKSPRAKALAGLKRLMGRRLTGNDSGPDIAPFGIVPRPKGRNPRDDRAVALVSVAVIDQGLEAALLTKFRQLAPDDERAIFSDDSAPLASFDAKVRLAFALGLLGKQAWADLTVIRRIRNTFAHSRLQINFDTPEIADAVGLLTLRERWPNMMPTGETTAREIFMQTSFQYALFLIALPNGGAESLRSLVLDT